MHAHPNRRDLIKSAGFAAATGIATVPVVVVAKGAACLAGQSCPEVEPGERVAAAIAELKAALLAAHPGVGFMETAYFPQGNGNLYLGLIACEERNRAPA